jgi:hypothetical protein
MKNLNEEKLSLILSGKDGNLSKDIEKMIKKDTYQKNKKPKTFEFKGESNF